MALESTSSPSPKSSAPNGEPRSPTCRFCATPLTTTFVDLGMSPLCQTHVEASQLHAMEPFYPLRAYVCEHCFLVQLPASVSSETLFKEYGVWVYSLDGTPVRGVLRGPDTTGYYTPLDGGNYALTRPKSKTFTLGLFDATRRWHGLSDDKRSLLEFPAEVYSNARAQLRARAEGERS